MTEYMGPDERAITGFTVPQRDRLLWIAADVDGTLAESIWTPSNPTSAIGPPIKRNVVKLREAVRAGYKSVLHTSRPWSDYEALEAWAIRYDVPFSNIVCGKLLAAVYCDDRARHSEESSWLPR